MGSLKRNFIYNTVYNLLSIFIPFITTPYISRILGPDGIGAYSYTYSIAYYFVLFTMLGLNKYGNRTIAAIRDNPEAINNTFSEIYVMQILTGTVSTIIYIICVLCVFKTNKTLFALQLIYVMSATFDVSWFFFGIEQFRLTISRNIIVRFINIGCLFCFVKKPTDVSIYCFIMAVSTFVSHMLLWPILLNKFVRLVKPTWKNVFKHFKTNMILFVPTIAVSLYKIMDKIMIGRISGTVEVGYYENAEKIINIPMTLITALGTVMLPRMTYYISTGNEREEKKCIDITLSFAIWISCAMSCGIIAIANIFVPFFLGKEFSASTTIVHILAPTMIFISCGTILNNQILIPRKKDKSYISVVIVGAIINFICNMILIPQFGSNGAAIATLFTEVVVVIGYCIASIKYFEWCNGLKQFFVYSTIGISMIILLNGDFGVKSNGVFLIIAKIVIGIVYYMFISIGVTYFVNQNFFDFIIKQIKGTVNRIMK